MKHTNLSLSLFFLTIWHPCITNTYITVDNTCNTVSLGLRDTYKLKCAPSIKKNITENNDALIRKFLTIILSIYKKKLLACIENLKGQDVAQAYKLLNYFDQLYDLIDLLPVAQLLDALDETIEEIYPLLEFYEFDSFMTWQEWIQKYSWLIPILAGKFVYIIFSKLELFEDDASDEGENWVEAEGSKTDQQIDQPMYQSFDVTELTIV